MNIKRFEDFLYESQYEDFDNVYEETHLDYSYEYDDLDEGFVDMVKSVLQKPNLKDPKTPKDFAEVVRAAASKMPEGKGKPIDIASRIRNLMSAYINKVGPFKERSGPAPTKPVSMMAKGGLEKLAAAAKAGAAAAKTAAAKAAGGK